jgi:hypothetical protein
MEQEQGWLKLYRAILKNETITYSYETVGVWVVLLCSACYEDNTIKVKGRNVRLKAGELLTTYDKLTNITQSPISTNTIRGILKELQDNNLIRIEGVRGVGTKITIVDWNVDQKRHSGTSRQRSKSYNSKSDHQKANTYGNSNITKPTTNKFNQGLKQNYTIDENFENNILANVPQNRNETGSDSDTDEDGEYEFQELVDIGIIGPPQPDRKEA